MNTLNQKLSALLNWDRPLHYILNPAGEPVPEPDILKWGEWYEHSEQRRVALDEPVPGVEVSTVFLALDHGFTMDHPPVLWETMVFCNEDHPWAYFQQRYCHREEAEIGHRKYVESIRAGKLPEDVA